MSDNTTAVLSPGVGYAVVLGIGLFFAAFMVGLTRLQNRYTTYNAANLEEFISASSSVKPGLIASGIVSAWTWAATLLQSSAVAYKFGIAGPWWYAAGATVQILIFSQNAVKLKINAPHAHTFLEVIRARWGRGAHFTFMFFGLATNIIVTSMLVTGGSDTVTALTGMPTQAACMLIPVGVVIYVWIGGLRASLLADYIHTSALFAIIIAFMFVTFATSDKIGSPSKMYDMLEAIGKTKPVVGNANGSYLTFRSQGALIFGIINVVGNFATVFLDQAYFQRAIASSRETTNKAFFLGGSAWLSVPLGFASTLGLAAVVLTTDPAFPNFPNPLSASQVAAGLPAPVAASTLLGATGAITMLILLFLAVTSAASAELVAVSSIMAYDVYVPYINPNATDKQILRVDHWAIVGYGFVMGFLGLIFFYAGISMGWLYEFMGVVLGAAVVPVGLAIISDKANRLGCIFGAWIGLAAGLITWLVVTAKLNNGIITIDTTFQDYCMLSGNLASLGTGGIIALVTSYIWPENYDFKDTRALYANKGSSEVVENEASAAIDESKAGDEKKTVSASLEGDKDLTSASTSITDEGDNADLHKAYTTAVRVSVSAFIVLILLIPLPLFGTSYIFPKEGYTAWVIVSFIWVFYGTGAVVLYPAWESREALAEISGHIIRDLFGGGLRKKNLPVEA